MTNESLPDMAMIEAAACAVYAFVPPTPQYRWPLLEVALGTETWVKHENHTPTGAFKARTAAAYIAQAIADDPGIKGFITATRGNHGQAVALAAKHHGRPAIVIVPHGNSAEKNAAMRAQGADVIEHGTEFHLAREHAYAMAAQTGYHFVPSYHPLIGAAVASYWMELFRAVSDIDVAYVGIGQGSGMVAAIAARAALGVRTKLVGVVSTGAPAYALSFAARELIEADVTTQLVDGLACRRPWPDTLDLICDNVDHIVQVSDAEVAEAMRLYFSATHNVIEGAGAAPLAAAMQERDALKGKRVAVIACGGNVDSDVFARVLNREI